MEKEVKDGIGTINVSYQKLNDSAVVHAMLQAIPYIGSSLDVLLFDEVIKWKEARINELLNGLQEQISKIDESKIDKEFLQSEEGIALFERVIRAVALEYNVQKREMLRTALVSAWQKNFQSTLSREFLINTLVSLNEDQIRILKFCFDKHGQMNFDQLRNIEIAKTEKIIVTYGELERAFWPTDSTYEKLGLIEDLKSKGLLFDWMVGRIEYSPFYFALTDFGRELIRVLISDDK